jgi:hypothetical protein
LTVSKTQNVIGGALALPESGVADDPRSVCCFQLSI